ncbi:hypothetical protein [Rhizobium sullae]|uniref:hypothetical protein n=1 Tax=Rhizobium sullae TaxID=50338 RepID=UPI000B3592AE|nr:hypothetical protein [Rhizobium sullae]
MPKQKWSSLKVLMLPVYALQIIAGEKRFIENPLLGSEKLNRSGLHIWRVKTAAKIVESRRQRLQHLIPQYECTFFAENGYLERRNFLAPEMFAQLRSEVEALRAPAREMTQGKAVTRRTPLTSEVVKNYPAIRALVNSNGWSNLLRYVRAFKAEPVISIQTTFGTETEERGGKDPQTDLRMHTFHSTVKACSATHLDSMPGANPSVRPCASRSLLRSERTHSSPLSALTQPPFRSCAAGGRSPLVYRRLPRSTGTEAANLEGHR